MLEPQRLCGLDRRFRLSGTPSSKLPCLSSRIFFFSSHLNKVSLQVSGHAVFEHPSSWPGMLRWVWGSSGCTGLWCPRGASPAVQHWSTRVGSHLLWKFLGFWLSQGHLVDACDRGGQGRGGRVLRLGHSFALDPSLLGNNNVFLTK